MKLANLETLGYNGGDNPLTCRRVPIASGDTFVKTDPFGKDAKAVSSLPSLSTAPVNPMSRNRTMEEIESLRSRIHDAISANAFADIDTLYNDPETRETLRSKLLNNERYALREAYNANRRREKRHRNKDIAAFARICGARAVKLEHGYMAIDPPQSTGDRKGADSDLFGDRSRNNHLPVDAVRDEHGVVMAD